MIGVVNPSFDTRETDTLFHALGDANRRRMVAVLSERSSSVSELASTLNITRTAVGQHLAVLEAARLARSVKSGRTRTCHLDPTGLGTLQAWVEFHRREWHDRLDRLGDWLEAGERQGGAAGAP